MAKLESKVQESIMKAVRKHGGYVYKNAQNMYTEKGRPDLTACIPVKVSKLMEAFGKDATVGLFVGLEVKRDNNGSYGTTEAQEIVGRQIKKSGGIWIKIDDPETIEALMISLEDTNAI